MLSFSLGLAVRTFGSDLEKFQKSGTGQPDFRGAGSTFWPGDLLVPKNKSRKRWFCEGMNLWWGFRGIPAAQMNSMVRGTHLGVVLHPKTVFFKYLVGISSFPGKLQMAPASLAYFPLWLISSNRALCVLTRRFHRNTRNMQTAALDSLEAALTSGGTVLLKGS